MLVEMSNDWLFLIFIQQTKHSNIVCFFHSCLNIYGVDIALCILTFPEDIYVCHKLSEYPYIC